MRKAHRGRGLGCRGWAPRLVFAPGEGRRRWGVTRGPLVRPARQALRQTVPTSPNKVHGPLVIKREHRLNQWALVAASVRG